MFLDMKDLIVCVCKSQKNQIKMNVAVGNEKGNSSKTGLMLFAEGSTLRAEFLLIFQEKSGKGRPKRDYSQGRKDAPGYGKYTSPG